MSLCWLENSPLACWWTFATHTLEQKRSKNNISTFPGQVLLNKGVMKRTERKKVLLGLAKRNHGPGRQEWSKNESQWYPGKKLERLGLPNWIGPSQNLMTKLDPIEQLFRFWRQFQFRLKPDFDYNLSVFKYNRAIFAKNCPFLSIIGLFLLNSHFWV